jgi:hypothetical protein
MTPAVEEPGEHDEACAVDAAASTAGDGPVAPAPKRVEWSTADLARAAGQRMGSRLSDEILDEMGREDSRRYQEQWYASHHQEYMARKDAEYNARIEEERRAAREAAAHSIHSTGPEADPLSQITVELINTERRARPVRDDETGGVDQSGQDDWR